ncbi:MAG TPA: SLBB domain-containing protein [Gemmatimonadales bacterium]|nr:SLBB domain-containing protein [Gemmatimonadales bacterium]
MLGLSVARFTRRLSLTFHLAAALPVAALTAQVPSQVPTPTPTPGALPIPTVGGQLPSPEVAQQLLNTRPDLVQQLQQEIAASGLTLEQIHARLRAAGYPENMLDPYIAGADTTHKAAAKPGAQVLEAVRVLGIVSPEGADSLLSLTDSAIHIADSLRADSLADTSRTLKIFGLSFFRKTNTLFQPMLAGPVDPNYRLGPGDGLVLILTGDVELAHELTVTREGMIAIPQVGQLYVANLTMAELEDLLYTRLGRVYSGVKRGPGATTHFTITVSRLRTIQVYVTGDVARPGSFQISAAGTALTALYAAGGPSVNGSFRHVEIRRAGRLVDSLDLYDYLLRGDNSHDVRLENGDVVFVPSRWVRVKIVGEVIRPAIYELRPGESLRDLLTDAGGFGAFALRRRVQIDRILPPAQRGPGRDRVVLDLDSDQFVDGLGPAFPMVPGDSVTVFTVPERRRDLVQVKGDVWTPGDIGWTKGMRLSEAIHLAGGPKPDVYLGQILVSRLLNDSSRIQLRSSFQDSTGAVTDDLVLMEDDEITIFSRMTFRPVRYVAVTGAVRKPGRIPFREGMTLRDAVLEVHGVTEDALLTEAEIARMPDDSVREGGRVATTFRVPLDSTYLFDRGPDGRYLGPPGLPAPAAGAAEVTLRPYDNILIFRQPDWELQRSVTILGKVKYPGRYSLLTRTDRLLDLINRSGGLTKEAYPAGIKFFRSVDRGGRIGIDLPAVLKDSTNRDNLVLNDGDSIVIPEYVPVVYVRGAVNAPAAVNFVPGENLDFYVQAAGGYAREADQSGAYVTQPNGKVQTVHRRFWFIPDAVPRPFAGGEVYVPTLDPKFRRDWLATATSLAQIIAALATTVLVVKNL